jgi:arsenite methyltransferase
MTDTTIKDAVRDKYGQAARRVGDGCCATNVGTDPISSNLYSD